MKSQRLIDFTEVLCGFLELESLDTAKVVMVVEPSRVIAKALLYKRNKEGKKYLIGNHGVGLKAQVASEQRRIVIT